MQSALWVDRMNARCPRLRTTPNNCSLSGYSG
jgi:hypothetical protein